VTRDEVLAELERGLCSVHKVNKEGCAQCGSRYAAIEAVKARYALPVIEACRMCRWCDVGPACNDRKIEGVEYKARRLADLCRHGVVRITDAYAAPPDWCPMRGRL
jgi:MinD superfamily P-loop ATPase